MKIDKENKITTKITNHMKTEEHNYIGQMFLFGLFLKSETFYANSSNLFKVVSVPKSFLFLQFLYLFIFYLFIDDIDKLQFYKWK